jgi:WhiB family transcriptional regulator, redox-sensing transcriptional regulator
MAEYRFPHDAVCTDVDPEIFFPHPGESAEPAKMICAGCPVRAECLEQALERGLDDGVLGGLTHIERRNLRDSAMRLRAVELALARRLHQP